MITPNMPLVASGTTVDVPLGRSFLGIPLRKFWAMPQLLPSALGVTAVAATVSGGLLVTDVVGVPVAISMFSGLVGGWVASALGAFLARDGWRGGVLSSICGLTVFGILSSGLHAIHAGPMLAVSHAANVPAGSPTDTTADAVREIKAYIQALPIFQQASVQRLADTMLKVNKVESSDKVGLSNLANEVALRRSCLIQAGNIKPAQANALAADVERLTINSAHALEAFKAMPVVSSPKRISAQACS